MAHIELKGQPGGGQSLIINGTDFSHEVFAGVEIVEVGEQVAVVGLRVTFAVSRLDLDTEADVLLTDQVPAVAARVRSMQEGVSA